MKLTVDGKSYTQPLTVKMDPRVKTSPAALLQQFTLSKRLSDRIDASAKAITEIRAMRARARDSAGPDSPIDKQLAGLEGQGGGGRFGGGGAGATDQPSFSRVMGELTGAYGLLQGADVAADDAGAGGCAARARQPRRADGEMECAQEPPVAENSPLVT